MGAPIENYLLTNDDLYLLAKGEWYRSYEKLGAHPCTKDGEDGYFFAVWAPDVRSVHVVGEFNEWNPWQDALTRTPVGGVWYTFIPGVVKGQLYKYMVETSEGDLLYKADPYAFHAEMCPGTASRTSDISGYEWGDKAWMDARKATSHMKRPLNIFEVHLGSWKRHDDGVAGNGDPDSDEKSGSYLTYDELSVELVDYVKQMGYSHIELLPIMEHPFDGSWGYQVTGYYAPTARYGEPKQFKHFVDACHEAGIGVILDWVPGGFCRDEHGLVHFNGHKLYEKEEHPNWGTFKFDYERGEVRTFLVSNLLYWVEEYHADGIRMDGVTSMLYLNFGVDDPSQKKFNEKGTEEDFVSIRFIQQCNEIVETYDPDVMMIAEESTAWPLVTYPPANGGLGFNYKWDMGWMNDTLHYCQTDFPFRPGNHKFLTFSIMYAFNENFVLPLSHDEVVHGKCSLVVRQPGDYWRQFAGLRSLAFYQITHPGGKLNFMGNEIGQFIEWRYYEGIQYFLTEEYDTHRNHQHFVAALNKFYNDQPALWQKAYQQDGFEWIDANNSEQSIVSFYRHGDDPKDDLVILINFDVNGHEDFRIGVDEPGIYQEVFCSDLEEYGGSGVSNGDTKFKTDAKKPWNLRAQSIDVRVPPLGGVVFKRVADLPEEPKKAPAKTAAKKAPARKSATRKPAARKTAAKADAAEPAKKTTRKRSTKAATEASAAPKTAKKRATAVKKQSKEVTNTPRKDPEEAK